LETFRLVSITSLPSSLALKEENGQSSCMRRTKRGTETFVRGPVRESRKTAGSASVFKGVQAFFGEGIGRRMAVPWNSDASRSKTESDEQSGVLASMSRGEADVESLISRQ